MNKNEILSFVEKVHKLKKDKTSTLPANSFFKPPSNSSVAISTAIIVEFSIETWSVFLAK